MKRPPLPRTSAAQAVSAFVAQVGRHARLESSRRKLDEIMSRACAIRAARGCTEAELDEAAAKYASVVLSLARQGAPS